MQRHLRTPLLLCPAVGGLYLLPPILAQQKKGNPLIVPGKSVGEIALCMENPGINKRLGQPTVDDAAADRYRGACPAIIAFQGGAKGDKPMPAIRSTRDTPKG